MTRDITGIGHFTVYVTRGGYELGIGEEPRPVAEYILAFMDYVASSDKTCTVRSGGLRYGLLHGNTMLTKRYKMTEAEVMGFLEKDIYHDYDITTIQATRYIGTLFMDCNTMRGDFIERSKGYGCITQYGEAYLHPVHEMILTATTYNEIMNDFRTEHPLKFKYNKNGKIKFVSEESQWGAGMDMRYTHYSRLGETSISSALHKRTVPHASFDDLSIILFK